MSKLLQRSPLSLFVIVLSLLTSLSFAQSKSAKEGAKKDGKVKDGKAMDLSSMPGVSVVNDRPVEKTYANEAYTFLVLVNPNDDPAVKLWTDLPTRFAGLKIEAMPGRDNAYLVVSKNPQLELFKRAYSGFFQIYSDSDLEMFSTALPCLAEIRSQIPAMTKKMSSN